MRCPQSPVTYVTKASTIIITCTANWLIHLWNSFKKTIAFEKCTDQRSTGSTSGLDPYLRHRISLPTLKDSGTGVANCHKQPADLFDRRCSTVSEIVESFTTLHQMLEVSQILISVSPVRHIKDGLIENSYSKSILRVACQEIVDNFSDTLYFPGYEMVTDDLRDYRFYGRDMVHPNEVAHDYIWGLFVKNYLDESSQRFIEQWEKIAKNLKHKAFHQDSEGTPKVLKLNTLSMLEQIPTHIDVYEEIQQIKAQLI